MASSRTEENFSDSFHKADSLASVGASSRSSLFSKIDLGAHNAQASLLRDDRMLLKSGHPVGKMNGEQAEPAKSKQGTLMKKLSWLINPKKKLPKPGARKRVSAMQEGGSDAKDHLELLFAQAEATLGELLVRAGASFNGRSTSQEDHHAHHDNNNLQHERASTSGGVDSASLRLGSSFSRSAGQGHARRNSLSRVWQQLGGSLFCGSGHMNAVVMEEMELRGIAPLPRTPSGAYLGEEDVVADESYWQSLAESIIMQRQKMTDDDQHAVRPFDQENDSGIKDYMAETSHDLSVTSASSSQHIHIAKREQEADRPVTEIISAPPDTDVSEDLGRWAACGVTLEGSHSELPVPSELRDGCARLNTTLDASPNLAQNYLLNIKGKVGSGAVGSSSNSVVDLLNYYSCPLPVFAADQVEEPMRMLMAAPSSSDACASSSNVEMTVQPLDDLLWHERGRWSVPANERDSESPSNVTASVTATNPIDLRAQQQLESVNCTRVSLMTLLHEESAAVELVDGPDVVEEAGRAQAVAPQDEEGLVGEEPLALFCCVCMVRRKGAALIPCGHTFCRICAKQLFAGRGACPLCNNLIVQLLDIF